MLAEVLDVVADQRWFDTSTPYEKCIYLSQGGSMWMVLSRRGRPDTFVKFSDLVSLASEAQRCEQATASYPEQAPKFLGYARRARLDVLATQALELRPVTAGLVLSSTDAAAIRRGLEMFFRRMQSNASPTGALPRHSWFEDMCAYFDRHALRDHARRALPVLSSVLSQLPAQPQHGDLVMNNLALDASRRLVIFDWEDFGALDLPGLDLFTVEYSFAVQTRRGPPHTPRPLPALDVDRCCNALGLDRRLYEGLRLCYALSFRYLKRRYGPEVQARMDRLIEALAAQADGKR